MVRIEIEGDGLTVARTITTALFFIAMLCLTIFPVIAESTVTVVYETPDYGPPNPPYRIIQGQNVYLNDTIDISGMGWGTGVAWYGTYDDHKDPVYLYEFTDYKKSLYSFRIDPEIFASRPGMWYQYYGNDSVDTHGNLRAFNVISRYWNRTTTYENGTMIISSQSLDTGVSEVVVPERERLLPDSYVADYVVARGDPLVIDADKLWVFGRIDGIYDTESGVLSAKDIQGLSTGSYKLVTHSPGANGVYEAGYNAETDTLTSPWRNVAEVDMRGMNPQMVHDALKQMVLPTDDRLATYNLEVQDMEIAIAQVDDVAPGGRVPEAYEPGVTLLDIRGYTNAANGTELRFSIDNGKGGFTSRPFWTTTAIETAPGNLRVYRIYIPINKNQMPPGIHTIKGWTPIGGEVFADFPINEIPADSFVPNATVRYVGDRNPWVAPVTVVVTQEIVKEVVKEVIVEVTPHPDVVYEQQLRAKQTADNEFWGSVTEWVKIGFLALAVIACLLYVGTVVYRGRKEK